MIVVNYVKERYFREYGEEIPASLLVGGLKELESLKMRFDLVMSNPPYNISQGGGAKNKSGSLGNQTAYNLFINAGIDLLHDSGQMIVVCPRQGIKNISKKMRVEKYSLDTSKHWKYQSGYFVATRRFDKEAENVTNDTIIKKTCNIEQNWKMRSNGGKVTESSLDSNGIMGIIEVPTGTSPIKMGLIRRDLAILGPKVISRVLETEQSYVATNLPTLLSAALAICFDSIDESEKCLLFLKKSKLLRYIHSKFNSRTKAYSFLWLKKFNLNQIVTGYEYPVEYGLTQEEIAYIEEQVR